MTPPNPDRRSPESHRKILRAAYELALERGPAKVTIEAIAARAGVGKQTIYRWWPSKGAVFLDVFNDAVVPAREIPDTGDLVADLKTQMMAVVDLFATDFGRFYAGLIAEAQSDPDLARALGETIATRAEAPRGERLKKAQEQGQLRADVDVTAAVEILFAPLHYRLLLHTAPLGPEHVNAIIDLAINGLMQRGPAAQSNAAGPRLMKP